MKNNFYFKLGIIFVLIIALLIPRTFLSSLINERLGWREQAYSSIQQSWPGD
jgi:inner membrane protein